MNWTASLLRNQLKKEREGFTARLNLLASTSLEAQNYLDLEEKLTQTLKDLATSEQNLTELKNHAESQEKDQVKELEAKESSIIKLAKKIASSKELIFNLRKEIRTNSLYYQTELRKARENYSVKLTEQTKNLTKRTKDLQQELTKQKAFTEEWKEAHQGSQAELLETKELLSIYRDTDALSFFNTQPEQVIKVLQQHPKKLYYLFYSTDSEAELDLASLDSNLEDNCLFLGTFGEGSLEVNLNKSQAEVISLRTPKPVSELFQFSKQKLFITDSTKLFSEGEPLILDKGKGLAATAGASTPSLSTSPTLEGEEKKKKKRFGFGRKEKDK